jgi:hypothetical protein
VALDELLLDIPVELRHLNGLRRVSSTKAFGMTWPVHSSAPFALRRDRLHRTSEPKPISDSEATIFWSTISDFSSTPNFRKTSVSRGRMFLKGMSSKRPLRKASAWVKPFEKPNISTLGVADPHAAESLTICHLPTI